MCPLPQFKGTVSRDIKYSIIFINPLLLVSLEVLYDDLIFRGVIQPWRKLAGVAYTGELLYLLYLKEKHV